MNTAADKKALLAPREKSVLSKEGALSTGSTLLNLACTDRADCGYLKGAYYYLVGDSVSGKTWLSLSCFAEACRSPAFKNYELIYDDVEGGALMDVAHYFGKDMAKRMKWVQSSTIESFYYRMADLIKARRPFIYVLDSQDALTSKAAAKKFAIQKKAAEEGEDSKGSYGDSKAKYHSENLRHVLAGLRRTKSILLVIGQTRDNLKFGFETRTRAGGRALRFYANLEIWTSVVGKILRTVRGKPRTVGARCLAEVKKNRVTGKVGKDRAVQIPIYYGLGIDDVGSCVDFLVAEKHWKKNENKEIDAKDILFTGSRGAVIAHIEEEGLEQKVVELTEMVWKQIENECLPERKRRYI